MYGNDQDLEGELRKYMSIEQAVNAISPRQILGAIVLDAQPAKHSLRSEAANWKAQFARNLHKQGMENLKVITSLDNILL